MNKNIKKTILTIASTVLLSSIAHAAPVPFYTSHGDLSSVTRASFKTGRVINPKPETLINTNNNMNGYFLSGSAVYKNTGLHMFTIPAGFTKILVVGCGSGGSGELQTGFSTVAATGGGGSGSCYKVTLNVVPNSNIQFYVASANGVYQTQLNNPLLYINNTLGFNGGAGSLPTWNTGWVDGIAGKPGTAPMKNGRGQWTNTSSLQSKQTQHGATLVTAGMAGKGYLGGVSKNKIYNYNYTAECHGGRGGDGIKLYNTNTPTAAEAGCVMISW